MHLLWITLPLSLLFCACAGDDFSEGPPGEPSSGGTGGSTTAGTGGNTTAGHSGSLQGGNAGTGNAGGDAGAGGSTAGAGGSTAGAGGSTAGAGGSTAGAGGSTAGAGGSTAGAGGNTAGAGGEAGAGGNGSCDDAVLDLNGVFVAESGDDKNDGTSAKPVKTLAKAVTLLSPNRTTLYLASNQTFLEQLIIPTDQGSISIHGGFHPQPGGTWIRNCAERAQIASTEATTVKTAVGNTPAIKLQVDQLRVKAPSFTNTSPSSSAKSSVAFHVTAPVGTLGLVGVELIAGQGENGKDGAAASSPSYPATCNTSCSQGKDGDPAAPGTPGNNAGTFSDKGYSPADGSQGNKGVDGKNGTPGTGGSAVDGCTAGCKGCNENECKETEGVIKVEASTCGCGGPGGNPGEAGTGGGASIALLVTANATIITQNCSFTTADGGKGGDGGDGSDGLEGTSGKVGKVIPYDGETYNDSKGEYAICHQGACHKEGSGNNCGCYYQDTKPSPTPVDEKDKIRENPPGGKGGKGGKGAHGGSGVGGPSIAIAYSKDGELSQENPNHTIGDAGQSGKDAPSGKKAETFPF